MAGYAVDPAALHAVALEIGEAESHARAALAVLTASADALFADGWRSPAAARFWLGWADWCHGVDDALAALEQLGRAVALAGRDYQLTDDEVRVAAAGTAA